MNLENEDAPKSGPAGGENRPEAKTITMAVIAKAAGVSQGAISSLLNDRDYGIRVSAKTRERVFRVCREMNYMPNDLRAVVRMYPKLGDFALLISKDLGLEDPFAARLAQVLIRQIPSHHLSVALYDPQADYSAAEQGALPLPVASGVASRFLTLGSPNISLFSHILAHEYPGVHIGGEAGIPGFTSIIPSYANASRQAIETLLALGHRQIAILSGPFGSTDPTVIELNFGIRAAYDAIKTPIEAQNVIYGEPTFEQGVTSADILLDRPQKPTAIFCFSTLVAAGVMHRVQARGVSIPRELSVIAFGEASFAPLLHPPLTTVTISTEEIASKALGDLEKRLQDQDITTTRRISVASAINERASCGPPKKPSH